MSKKKVIVIGSGVAGMAVAIRLATDGYETHVYEKNATPGGKLSVFEKDGYRFDKGPSLFTQPNYIEDLFAYAGEPIEAFFTYRSVDVSCHYFYENGKKVNAYTQADQLAEELSIQLQENPEVIIEYLNRAKIMYDKVGQIFLNNSLHKSATWLKRSTIDALRTVGYSDLFTSMHQFNEKKFRSKETVQLFNRYATYNGSNPYQAPGMLCMIPHLELNEGTYYPTGGMISITNALYELAIKKGVSFHFNTPVEKIIIVDKKAVGIRTIEGTVDSDLVVSNGDVYYTFRHLLDDGKRATRIAKTERSSSALIFYWGIKKTFEQLGLHNIFFSESYKSEFAHIFESKTLHDDPTVYINITSKMEPGHAPSDCENWFVMINAPVQEGQQWDELIATARKNIIQKLSRMLSCEIEQYIVSESVLNPISISENTLTYKGALYGTSSNSKWSAFLRPANFSSKYNGLYFCGGTVHPGGGIPLCLKSAEITACLIRNELNQTDA